MQTESRSSSARGRPKLHVPPSSTTEGYAHKDGQKLTISKTSSLSAPSPHLGHPIFIFIQHNRLQIYYYVQFYLQLTAQQ